MSPIETGMYFLLGLSVTAVVAILCLHGVWRAGVATGRRRAKKAEPSQIAELRAERDQLKAEQAMGSRKLELRLGELKTRLAEQMAEVARTRNRIDHLANEIRRRDDLIGERDKEVAALKQMVIPLEEELRARSETLEELRSDLRERDDTIARLESEVAFVRSMHTQDRLGRAAGGGQPARRPVRPATTGPMFGPNAVRPEAGESGMHDRPAAEEGGLLDKIAALSALAGQIESQRQELQRKQRVLGETEAAPVTTEPGRPAGGEADRLGEITAALERQLAEAEMETGALQAELSKLDDVLAEQAAPSGGETINDATRTSRPAAPEEAPDDLLSTTPGEPRLSREPAGLESGTEPNVVSLATRIRSLNKESN